MGATQPKYHDGSELGDPEVTWAQVQRSALLLTREGVSPEELSCSHFLSSLRQGGAFLQLPGGKMRPEEREQGARQVGAGPLIKDSGLRSWRVGRGRVWAGVSPCEPRGRPMDLKLKRYKDQTRNNKKANQVHLSK